MVEALREHRRKPFQPLCNLVPSITDTDANGGNTETIGKSLITIFNHGFEFLGDVGQDSLQFHTESCQNVEHK